MKTITFTRVKILVIAILMSGPVFAQDKPAFTITPSADLVSNYVWRGVYQSGVSIQPSLTASWNGLSLSAWGSTDFSTLGKEFDLTLGYENSGFLVAVTDYWWEGEGFRYGDYSKYHYFEGTIGYHFGEKVPLGLMWNTMFGMDGDRNEKGEKMYSTYIEATYDFSVKDIYLTAAIGVSPWTGMYHREGKDGFALCAISLRVTKDLKITNSFELPIFVEATVAPNQDNVFLTFGLTIQ